MYLEDERGTALSNVEDQANLLHRLLPDPNDISFHMLRFIDWYGDTVFNRLQLESFLQEWDRIAPHAQTEEARSLLGRVRDLATKGPQLQHTYLKFYGDGAGRFLAGRSQARSPSPELFVI